MSSVSVRTIPGSPTALWDRVRTEAPPRDYGRHRRKRWPRESLRSGLRTGIPIPKLDPGPAQGPHRSRADHPRRRHGASLLPQKPTPHLEGRTRAPAPSVWPATTSRLRGNQGAHRYPVNTAFAASRMRATASWRIPTNSRSDATTSPGSCRGACATPEQWFGWDTTPSLRAHEWQLRPRPNDRERSAARASALSLSRACSSGLS